MFSTWEVIEIHATPDGEKLLIVAKNKVTKKDKLLFYTLDYEEGDDNENS